MSVSCEISILKQPTTPKNPRCLRPAPSQARCSGALVPLQVRPRVSVGSIQSTHAQTWLHLLGQTPPLKSTASTQTPADKVTSGTVMSDDEPKPALAAATHGAALEITPAADTHGDACRLVAETRYSAIFADSRRNGGPSAVVVDVVAYPHNDCRNTSAAGATKVKSLLCVRHLTTDVWSCVIVTREQTNSFIPHWHLTRYC